ncbi:DUF488 domain-containing protein [Avibacterium endocarditidis]|uniref:DUF488 domain-containing protein n=1 Tax=Avibacterium TaxID=292486 RepID=UPI0039FCF547
MKFTVKRIYDKDFSPNDFRVLIDRLWPRGVSKLNAHITLWEKELSPSSELRKRYHHAEITYLEFAQQYAQELQQNAPLVQDFLQKIANQKEVVLVTAVKDIEHSHVPILLRVLENASIKNKATHN